ncbi:MULTISPECIES: hypothetical protein [unclassified Sphingomonas]|nr:MULTISPECIES: hypothetical protein [unclassified Sphingomonas]HEV7287430.1 hypothetical protein [Sphingomonas sp.]
MTLAPVPASPPQLPHPFVRVPAAPRGDARRTRWAPASVSIH